VVISATGACLNGRKPEHKKQDVRQWYRFLSLFIHRAFEENKIKNAGACLPAPPLSLY
jgi:hypothetical protein